MKTFHATRNIKLTYLSLLLLMLIGFGILGYMQFWLFSAFSDLGNGVGNTADSLSLILSPMCSIPLLFFLFILVWMGITVVAVYKTRLNFDEQTIKLESLRYFTFFLWGSALKPFTIPYDQIRTIRSIGLVAAVQILDTNGKKYTLAPALFGKNFGEEVLVELQNRLPSDRIESGMEIPDMLRKWAKGNKARVIFILTFVALLLSTMAVDPMFSSRSWFISAWKVDAFLPTFENVWTYSLVSQSEVWFLASKINSYKAYHFVSGDLQESWDVPYAFIPKGSYPDFVSNDGNGKPLIWVDDRTLHYDGTWKATKYQDNLQVTNLYSSGFVMGVQGWAIAKDENTSRIIKINGQTGEWSELPLPKTAIEQNLYPTTILQAPTGERLVLMTSKSNARVYLLSNGVWETLEFALIMPDDFKIRSFFLDIDNSLWVLFSSSDEWFVEQVFSNGELRLTQLPSPNREIDEWERYEEIFVDSHGRLWISGSYPNFMSVFSPIWKDTAFEMMRYTEENSNFQGSKLQPLVMTSDGRIWTLDRRITSIDTNLEVLPTPLPAWFADLDWGFIRLYIILAQFLFSIYLLIISLVRLMPRKNKAQK
jgi:hypothetical protein